MEDSITEIKKSSDSKGIQFLKILRFLFLSLFSRPGKWMQSLTTKEPEDSMIEVAIASVSAVFDWKAYLAELKTKQKDQKTNKIVRLQTKAKSSNETISESAVTKENSEDLQEEEEDKDEVLDALDKFFVYKEEPKKEDKKKGKIRF